MIFSISLVFENFATDFTPHFLSTSWRIRPEFCRKFDLFTLLEIIIGLFVKTGT